VRTASLIKILSAALLDSTGSVLTVAGEWDAGAVLFVEGEADTYDLVLTGPSGYATGGIYSVDSGTLPTGITLSEAGVLSYDGIGSEAETSIVFAYTEPNALPTLTLHSTSAGTFPYMATVFPCEGAVPSGMSLISPDDATMRGNVLSAWPDGSAQVVVVAGHKAVSASAQTTIGVRPAIQSGTSLTTSDIDSLLSDLTLNFNGTPQTFNTWTSPTRTWWANSQVICASYVVPITGMGAMEAIVYVHAFAGGRAFVEVVIENGKLNADATTVSLAATPTQTYTSATVSINGIALNGSGTSSPTTNMAAPNSDNPILYQTAGHQALRAWYCSGWVGGDPQIEVTHDIVYMRKHPFFFAPIEESTKNQQTANTNAYDTYVPWACCRISGPDMGAGGAAGELGLFTECQSDYFQYGSKYAARAVIATGLAALSLDFNWRHTNGTVPTREQVYGKTNGNVKWPFLNSTPRYGGISTRDASHIPAMQLVPFLCRPSPVFIELAQKEFCWNHAYGNSDDGGHSYDQVRSRGWGARNYASAILLTPDSDTTRKAGMRLPLLARAAYVDAFFTRPWNTLELMYGLLPSNSSNWDHADSRSRLQTSSLVQQYAIIGMVWVEATKVLRGSDAATWTASTDSACKFVTRRILEATGGEWRLIPYTLTFGDLVTGSPDSVDMGTGNWGDMTRNDYTGTPPPDISGPILFANASTIDWANVSTITTATVNENTYWWGALCAVAERDGPSAAEAWDKVITDGGISNFAQYRTGFATLLFNQWNRWPRNK